MAVCCLHFGKTYHSVGQLHCLMNLHSESSTNLPAVFHVELGREWVILRKQNILALLSVYCK